MKKKFGHKGLGLGLIYLFLSSSLPTVLILRLLFYGGLATVQQSYTEAGLIILENKLEENLLYDYYVKEDSQPLATLVWLHGGAFVAGDKQDVHEYAVELAQKDYEIYLLAYPRSPKGKNPDILLTIAGMMEKLSQSEKLYLAGDSAGAFLALQYQMASLDSSYHRFLDLDFELDNPADALLLFSGPFQLGQAFADSQNQGGILAYFSRQIEASFLGPNLQNRAALNLLDYLQFDPGPVFVTDGLDWSFFQDAQKLAWLLEENQGKVHLHVPQGETSHEYQFKMDQLPAQEAFEALILFLEKLQGH